jgi:hypothetical protein
VIIQAVEFLNALDNGSPITRTWDDFAIAVRYECVGELPQQSLGIALAIERERDLQLIAQFGTASPSGDDTLEAEAIAASELPARRGTVWAIFPRLQLLAGDYLLSIGLLPVVPGQVDFYEYRHRFYRLRVVPAGYPSGAIFYPRVEWRHDRRT